MFGVGQEWISSLDYFIMLVVGLNNHIRLLISTKSHIEKLIHLWVRSP